MTNNDLARANDGGIDRRKLLKMGAWAAPVVVLAAAVPAASASPIGGTQSFATPQLDISGDKDVTVKISGTASGAYTATLTVTDPVVGPGNSGDKWSNEEAPGATQVVIGTGAGFAVIQFPTYNKKSANSLREFLLIITIDNVEVYRTITTG